MPLAAGSEPRFWGPRGSRQAEEAVDPGEIRALAPRGAPLASITCHLRWPEAWLVLSHEARWRRVVCDALNNVRSCTFAS